MPKRSSSKSESSADPSTEKDSIPNQGASGESFASLVKKDGDGSGKDAESFASLVKKPRPKTKNDGTKKKKRARTRSGEKSGGKKAGATSRKRAATSTRKAKKTADKPIREERREPETYDTTVAVFESGASNQKRAVDVANALGYQAKDTRRDAGKLSAMLAAPVRPELLILGMPGNEGQLAQARAQSPTTMIIASMPGPADSARRRALELGADLFVVRPHTKDSLAVVLLAAAELAEARKTIRDLKAGGATLPEAPSHARPGPERTRAETKTGFPHFDFFERLLILELKRAKRFGYSLATALVGFDDVADLSTKRPAALEEALREKVAQAIRANIRDIDVPVDYADGRILLFLSYTDLDGAKQVGSRVVAAVRKFGHAKVGALDGSCTVSIGISAVRPGTPISFARLMKDANQALRAAQLKGGDRVVVRT